MDDKFLDVDKMQADGVEVVHAERLADQEVVAASEGVRPTEFADLTEMSRYFKLFCMSPVLQFLGQRCDPVVDFIQKENLPSDLQPKAIDLPFDIFHGFEREFVLHRRVGDGQVPIAKFDLNRRLYACPFAAWDRMLLKVGGASCVSKAKRYYARACKHETKLVDVPRLLQRYGRTEATILEILAADALLEITAFAVATPRTTYVLRFYGGLDDLPKLDQAPAQPRIVVEAGQMFK